MQLFHNYCNYFIIIAILFQNYCNFISKLLQFYFITDGGRCVAFNPNDDTMFLVGTDEGLIYKCTTEYSSKFLQTYPAHNTPIYNISWNPYVSSIFLTCAAEWMIKIWDHNST